MFSSSGIGPQDAESSSTRPRNRRPNAVSNTSSATANISSSSSGGLLSPTSTDRPYSSLAADSRNGNSGRTGGLSVPTPASWGPYWSTLQEFTSTLFAGSGSSGGNVKGGRNGGPGSRKPPSAWGPAPPSEPSSSSAFSSSRPRVQDVAVGQVAAREAEFKARKTASVLESHPGVNGGLDVRGKYKRRTSDEIPRGSTGETGQESEDCLAYIHRVQPTDTYFGIVLKYRCHDDTFRKANGLWSRDNIQIRKWVVLPVDACEIKGRPCDDPSLFPQGVDLLSSTPRSAPHIPPQSSNSAQNSDYFSSTFSSHTRAAETPIKAASEDAAEPPWTHVRWVRLDPCPDPVEIVRMSRTALGYFPPRRKKSMRSSMSSISTPRASIEISASSTTLPDRTIAGSPNRGSPRPSLFGGRAALGTSPMSSSPSRQNSGLGKTSAPVDPRPEWMRRPGGVGSMSKSVRAPGPARDSLNKWTTKHLPGFNIETLPSMSIMGSETAHFGFGDETAGIVESSFEDGRDATSSTPKDSGLDKAAASIDAWLRNAFTKGSGTPNSAGTPSTSFAGRIGTQLQESLGDLIELEDGPREDGGPVESGGGGVGGGVGGSLSSQATRLNATTGWRAESEGSARGRSSAAKGKKVD